jgi:hypothetical protein
VLYLVNWYGIIEQEQTQYISDFVASKSLMAAMNYQIMYVHDPILEIGWCVQ